MVLEQFGYTKKENSFSRQNKPLVLPQELINKVMSNSVDLDGELTIPGKTFNEVSGIVRHLDLIPEKDFWYILFLIL